jgi:putative ABC transport system permease protein
MCNARWRKLGRDLWAEKGRALLMITAITVSLIAIGAVLGAYGILTREIAVNYLGTRPASVTFEIPGGIDAALVAQVRKHPLVAEAEAREVIVARARVGDDWRRMLLFVIEDFADLRLNRFRPESGTWPPPDGTMLIERSAVPMLEVGTGQRLLVKPPHGEPRELPITGLVHDPGLAPAWQERMGYAYITRATLGWLGEPPVLTELRVGLRGQPLDPRVIETQAATVAKWLGELGHPVHQIRVPPPAQHPHQRQMATTLLMMLAFAVMALLLSAILMANSLAAMLARQVREIGVMKTLGARSGQIAGLYVVFVGLVGLASVLLAIPVGMLGARAFTGVIAELLNFTVTNAAIPGWAYAVQALSGILVPLAMAAIPIRRASRTTVRQALDDYGVSADRLHARFASLPTPLRNALRQPARLALTLGLLSIGGAMFMTAINVKRGWEANLAKVYETRSYDVEILLQSPQPVALAERLRSLPGVRAVEAWGFSPAAFSKPGEIDVVRTYPDRGHGSMAVMGPPPGTTLIRFPLRAGRWLAAGDGDAVVLNHGALAQAPQLRVGDPVTLSLDGQPTVWRVIGIVEEIGSPGAAYVTDDAFARATGTEQRARLLRVATTARSPEARLAAIRAVEQALGEAHIGVESAIPLAEHRTAIGDHILILVQALMALAVILAIVGTLGLASTMGISVVERTREFGVMKAIGATPGRVVKMIMAEALFIAAVSWILAVALAVPLTALVDWLVGTLGFLAPLPLVLAPAPALLWLVLVGSVAPAATLLPARRASHLTVRAALAHP